MLKYIKFLFVYLDFSLTTILNWVNYYYMKKERPELRGNGQLNLHIPFTLLELILHFYDELSILTWSSVTYNLGSNV